MNEFRFWCQKVLPLVYDDSLSYYELLCKVVIYLNNVIKTVNNISESMQNIVVIFEELKKFVEDYFKNLDVQDEIDKKLDEMAANGQLSSILAEALNLRMEAVRKERFQNAIRKTVVSYLARNYGGSYFKTGSAVPCDGVKMVVIYSNQETWQSYRWGSTPVYSDKITITGEQYSVMYCDCSSFTGLVFNNIMYDDSPYMLGFKGTEVNSNEMILSAFPKRGLGDDIAIDFNSMHNTKRMSTVLTMAGFVPMVLCTRNLNESPVLNMENIEILETGDVVFAGSGPLGATMIENTTHCMTYIKTMEELDEFGKEYGCTFKPVDNMDQSMGFIVEVTGVPNTNNYKNRLQICTLAYVLTRYSSDITAVTYAYKIAPTALDTNLGNKYYTGFWRDYNKIYWRSYSNNDPLQALININLAHGSIEGFNFKCKGEFITEDIADADLLDAGIWRCTSAVILGKFKNIPLKTNYFDIECVGVKIGDGFYGTQIFKAYSRLYPRLYVRSCVNGDWSPWWTVPQVQSAFQSFGLLTANSYQQVIITFDTPFDTVPIISTSLKCSSINPKVGLLSVAASGVSSDGFTLTVYNASDLNFSVGVDWKASTNTYNGAKTVALISEEDKDINSVYESAPSFDDLKPYLTMEYEIEPDKFPGE